MTPHRITLPPAPWCAGWPRERDIRPETTPSARVTLKRQITARGNRSRITQAVRAIRKAHLIAQEDMP